MSGGTRRTTQLLAGLLALVLVAGACSTSGDAGGSGGGVPAPASTIEWSDCGTAEGFECGTLEVPLDYEHPDAGTMELAVTRHPASKPDQRIGALLLNPGGPGASAVEFAQQLLRSGDIGDRFDIVGFDPRGVGGSSPLDCHSHLQEMYDADPTIDSAADRQEILDTSQAFVDECEARDGDVLPFLSTTDVARDMDEVRKALGEDQINYAGFSYGTSLGQEYARLFPTKVRAMILDGVVDHAPDGLTTAESQAQGFDTAFQSYVKSCEEDGCGFGGQAATDVVDEVIAAAEKEPIPAPGADRPATPGVVSLALAQALYSEQLWGVLSSVLRDAQDGDGTGLVDLADQYLGRGSDGSYGNGTSFEVYFGTSCLDDTFPHDPDAVLDASIEAEKEVPRFGGAIVSDYVRCALWPAKARPLEPVPADTKGLPPILVVSTTHDPATPYENGVHVAEQIPGAVLLTNEGEGHTVVLQGKPCIDDAATKYLVDLETPPKGTVCK